MAATSYRFILTVSLAGIIIDILSRPRGWGELVAKVGDSGRAGSGPSDPAAAGDQRADDMSETDDGRQACQAKRPWLTVVTLGIAASLILVGLVLASALSRERVLQVDEVEHIHATRNVRSGLVLYRDFWEGHNPLLYLMLYPAVDPAAPEEAIAGARRVMLVLWLVTLAAAAWVAYRLAGRWAATTAAGLLVLHTTFVERGLEVRPDGLVASLILAALVVEVSRWPRLQRSCLQGLILGLAFLASQKAAFFSLAFGIVWLIEAARTRRPALVIGPCLVWAVPVLVMLGWAMGAGALPSYLQYNFFDAARHAVARPEGFSPWFFLQLEGGRNPAFVLCAAAGLIWGIRRSWRAQNERIPGLEVVVVVALTAVASLWLNPFPYPYLHVSVVPPLAVLAGAAFGSAAQRHAAWRPIAVLVVLLAAAATAWPRLVHTTRSTMAQQLDQLRTIQMVTAPSDPVFDLAGLYFRPDAYPVFTMTHVMIRRYRQGVFPRMVPFFRERGLVAAMMNYRSNALPQEEAAFLADHMVHYGGNVYVLGTQIVDLEEGEVAVFEALADKEFRFEGQGTLLVDEAPFDRGRLVRGDHTLRAGTPPPRGRLVLDVPPPPDPGPPRPLFEAFD